MKTLFSPTVEKKFSYLRGKPRQSIQHTFHVSRVLNQAARPNWDNAPYHRRQIFLTSHQRNLCRWLQSEGPLDQSPGSRLPLTSVSSCESLEWSEIVAETDSSLAAQLRDKPISRTPLSIPQGGHASITLSARDCPPWVWPISGARSYHHC